MLFVYLLLYHYGKVIVNNEYSSYNMPPRCKDLILAIIPNSFISIRKNQFSNCKQLENDFFFT